MEKCVAVKVGNPFPIFGAESSERYYLIYVSVPEEPVLAKINS
jgi:hypothetical protein